ncbi:MAG: NlpC/P60 family protein [Aliarcobacter sp.]
MLKKTFILIPIIMMFTACSDKNLALNEPTNLQTSAVNSKLSYNEYKRMTEEKNKKNKVKPLVDFKTVTAPIDYKSQNNTTTENNLSNTITIPTRKQAFTDFYNEWKNVKYKLGGNSRKGIDCSAFTQRIYKEKFDIDIPRTTLTQVNEGVEVAKSELIPGDLVFFKTSKTDKHVGVYVGNNKFLHASIKGIQYTSLDKPFYKKNYWTSRRIIE